jgi:hypothetical protein
MPPRSSACIGCVPQLVGDMTPGEPSASAQVPDRPWALHGFSARAQRSDGLASLREPW